jgi:hypothetical protein
LTNIRKSYRDEAMKHVDDTPEFTDLDIIDTINAFSAKMKRGYFSKKILQPQLNIDDLPSDVSDACKRRSKRKPPALEELVEICHELRIRKLHHKDIAQKHNVTVSSIA